MSLNYARERVYIGMSLAFTVTRAYIGYVGMGLVWGLGCKWPYVRIQDRDRGETAKASCYNRWGKGSRGRGRQSGCGGMFTCISGTRV
jgi:hypothetical protein